MTFARTKIQPPRPRSAYVERALVQARLADALLNSRVILLCAPAGYGKTTALAHEIARLPPEHAVAWISADAVVRSRQPARAHLSHLPVEDGQGAQVGASGQVVGWGIGVVADGGVQVADDAIGLGIEGVDSTSSRPRRRTC